MVPAEQKKLREEDNSLLAVANDHIAECERYAVIADEELGNVSAEVQILMEEFVDLMPVEMLDELPPMTDVQHCIDFMPCSIYPSLSHYRMSLREHYILQGHVNKVLRKGTFGRVKVCVLF